MCLYGGWVSGQLYNELPIICLRSSSYLLLPVVKIGPTNILSSLHFAASSFLMHLENNVSFFLAAVSAFFFFPRFLKITKHGLNYFWQEWTMSETEQVNSPSARPLGSVSEVTQTHALLPLSLNIKHTCYPTEEGRIVGKRRKGIHFFFVLSFRMNTLPCVLETK